MDATIAEYRKQARWYSYEIIRTTPYDDALRRAQALMYYALCELGESFPLELFDASFKGIPELNDEIKKARSISDENWKRAVGQIRLAIAHARHALRFIDGGREIELGQTKSRKATKAAAIMDVALDALAREVSSFATGFDGNLRPDIVARLENGRRILNERKNQAPDS